jgi:hypothetical protein
MGVGKMAGWKRWKEKMWREMQPASFISSLSLVCALDAESYVPVGAPSGGAYVDPWFGRRE